MALKKAREDINLLHLTLLHESSTQGAGKNPPANAGDVRDTGLTPGSGRSPEEKMATHSSILAWRISWTEELAGLQSMVLQRVRHN